MQSTIRTAPATCPISIDDLMDHLAVTDPDQESLVTTIGLVATQYVEDYCGQLLVQRPVVWISSRGETEGMDAFYRNWLSSSRTYSNLWNMNLSGWIELPYNAVSIDSVNVGMWGQSDTTLVLGTDYLNDLLTDPARIKFTYKNTYNLQQQDHLVVNFTAGITADPTQIPTPLIHAIKMIAANLWKHRGDEESDFLSPGVRALLANYRRPVVGGR